MNLKDVRYQRLANERLVGQQFKTPREAVDWLGAVQSQDYPGAKWAIGQRVKNCLDSDIEQAFTDGRILRTHMLRPTWHFVIPEDIRWIQALTAPRVNAFNAYYYRKLGLDTETFKKGSVALVKALQGGKQLTRTEVKKVYEAAGIDASGLRLAYLIMWSELDAIVCSGALQGKQHTYALVADRAPKAKTLSHDEALAELTKRYFTSHGPAQIQDFAWWSSLTISDIKKGIDLAGSKLVSEIIDGKTFWFAPDSKTPKIKSPLIHLLPNYDEALIAYKDRSPLMATSVKVTIGNREMVFANHIITLDGQVVGGWKRTPGKGKVLVRATLLIKLDPAKQSAIKLAVEQFSGFLKMPVELV